MFDYTQMLDDLTHLDAIEWSIFFEHPQKEGYCIYWQNRHTNPLHVRRKEIRQAEFLVHEYLPLAAIREIGVISQQAQNSVRAALRGTGWTPDFDTVGLVLLKGGDMAVKIASGDLLEQRVDAIVNTVNTVGVMGKGIALQFKRKWPANLKAYEAACNRGQVVPGKMFVFDNGGLVEPKFIINFPTKRHWRQPSRLADIEVGGSNRRGCETIEHPLDCHSALGLRQR